MLLVAVAPEASRIAEFGGSAGNVANARDSEPRAAAGLWAQRAASDAGDGAKRLDLFDDDLGNLFGDVPPLEMLGIWPSGDFRVEPGGGAVPAPLFYLGALIGLAALAVGLRAAVRARETALPAALAAAVVIWLAALLVSTPYTTAKALMMIAAPLTLIAARGVLDPRFCSLRALPATAAARGRSALAVAFVLAAAGSSALALANAPVGPERYTAGIAKLRAQLTGEPVACAGSVGPARRSSRSRLLRLGSYAARGRSASPPSPTTPTDSTTGAGRHSLRDHARRQVRSAVRRSQRGLAQASGRALGGGRLRPGDAPLVDLDPDEPNSKPPPRALPSPD